MGGQVFQVERTGNQENKNWEFYITTPEDVIELRKFVSENRIEVVSIGMNYADGVRSFVVRVF